MNKRKIFMLALTVMMVAILSIGGSLAYLMDTDAQVNVFTTGNVAIDLFEDFGDNDDETLEKLLPTTGLKNENGAMINGIEKEVYIENTGSEPAFVRVHIAIPDALDSGAKDIPALNASNNIVHFNMSAESFADGNWNWGKADDAANYPANAADWNVYQADINGIIYNVYVVTFETALEGATATEDGGVTCDAIFQVYMDKNVTNEQINTLKNDDLLGEEWMIYVAAEGCQAQGFEDAFTALNASFGTPGTYNVTFTAEAEGKTLVETTAISERYPANN